MKKIALMMCACAALSFGFSSCEKEPGTDNGGDINFDEVIEDGFYVAGEATGSDKLTADYMMAAGINEADNQTRREGMYEKYVALEANKDFSLILYEAGVETRYSAVLEDYDTKGENYQTNAIVGRGELVTGAEAPAMRVKESGLYHILLDLNKKGDLANPQIVVAPVHWTINVSNNEAEETAFNRTSMSWTIKDVEMAAAGKFKFYYGRGWKIQLDDAGNVKANTNLGNEGDAEVAIIPNGLVPGGKDIVLTPGTYTIKLTWNLKGGEIKNSFVGEVIKTKDAEKPDFSTWKMGLVGSICGTNWDADQEFTYDATIDGWVLENLALNAGEQFKVRTVGTWDKVNLGFTGITITGDKDNFEDKDGNIGVVANATYAKVTLKHDFATGAWTIDFQK